MLLSIPTYSLGFIFLFVFAYRLEWLPLGGGTSFQELILPAITLGLFGVPYYTSVVSESTRTSLAASYTRTAVAKGLPRRLILRRHVVRNCLSPVITLAGLDFAVFLSGVVFVEAGLLVARHRRAAGARLRRLRPPRADGDRDRRRRRRRASSTSSRTSCGSWSIRAPGWRRA